MPREHRRALRASDVAFGLALVLACPTGCAAPPDALAGVRLHLPRATGCQPTSLASVRIVALGDFAPLGERVVEGDPAMPISIDRFPADTLALAVTGRGGTWSGFGLVRIDETTLDTGRDVLLLPVGVPCPVGDPELRAPIGAATAELPDGSLVIVGGLDDDTGRGTRRVVRLEAGREVADVEAVVPQNRIAFASATAIGGTRVLVAGGASAADGEVRDNVEILDLDGDAHPVAIFPHARREHAAVLVDDVVVLVGGRDESGVLGSIERVVLDPLGAETARARLVHARRNPIVVVRADGSLVVAGGRDDEGDPIASIEIVSADLGSSEEVSLGLPPPRYVVVLPGPRLLWGGVGDVADRETFIVTLDGEIAVAPVELEPTPDDDVIGVALADGRAFLSGRSRGLIVTSLVDPATQTVTAVASSREPGVRVALHDGVVLELDETGAAMRRESVLHELGAPPASWQLPADQSLLLLDAPGRWLAEAGAEPGLRALSEGARIDVPALRLARFALRVRVVGAAEILLTSDAGALASVELGTDVGIGTCRAARASEIVIVRDGDAIELAGTRCTLPDLPARVGVAIRAGDGAVVRSIALERLE